MSNNIHKIDNFDLNLFSNFLSESLQVTSQLMLEFKDNMVKSASFSNTKSLIKLITIPINKFIHSNVDNDISPNQGIIDLDIETIEPDFSEFSFNFYILKGDLFSKYISVFSKELGVSLEFNVVDDQAISITIIGNTVSGHKIKTTFPLTKEELIINKIDDYTEVIDQCTPTTYMNEFLLSSQQVVEIKSLIKTLHKSSTENTSFLSFSITNKKILIYDKVFEIEFDNINPINFDDSTKIDFNILKSDFLIIGNHSFKFYTHNDTEKVIMGTSFKNAIIWCLTNKHNINSLVTTNESDFDNSIDALDLSEYLDSDDLNNAVNDLPF